MNLSPTGIMIHPGNFDITLPPGTMCCNYWYPFPSGFDRCVTSFGHVDSEMPKLIEISTKHNGYLVTNNLKVKLHLPNKHDEVAGRKSKLEAFHTSELHVVWEIILNP
jgi:hypothetical protein